jgi:hypothetical protein
MTITQDEALAVFSYFVDVAGTYKQLYQMLQQGLFSQMKAWIPRSNSTAKCLKLCIVLLVGYRNLPRRNNTYARDHHGLFF